MNTQEAYNQWSKTYDEVVNKTRDLEGVALREILGQKKFEYVLEIGCGTGKNSIWLIEKAKFLTSVDLSNEMLAKAKEKIKAENINFVQADITENWYFANENQFDFICFSLVLEHIENLEPIFEKVYQNLQSGGFLYIGELHPFKQYNGTKARFETESGIEIVDCFNHHISDFIENGLNLGLKLLKFEEYFDENDRNGFPRILALLFKKL
jgi:SAM-dependent methyltransferase